jgi:hypothetical protein
VPVIVVPFAMPTFWPIRALPVIVAPPFMPSARLAMPPPGAKSVRAPTRPTISLPAPTNTPRSPNTAYSS